MDDLDDLLRKLSAVQDDFARAEWERHRWLRKCHRAGATGRQMALATGLSVPTALKWATKRLPLGRWAESEVREEFGITREPAGDYNDP